MPRHRHDRDKDKRDKNRFYLLPGQGGRAHRRKQSRILTCSIIVALVVAGVLAGLMYWMSRPRLH